LLTPHITTTLLTTHVFSNANPTSAISTLSLHDALPISTKPDAPPIRKKLTSGDLTLGAPKTVVYFPSRIAFDPNTNNLYVRGTRDRKSTRLNSSHVSISYAVFCLKKKKI